jgi:predicted DNA-binding protein with PD1-like motif
MQARELTIGRTIGVTFDHGEDFFETLAKFCREYEIRQGYIPMFLAGFAEAEIVGTCEKIENPDAPVWSKVYLQNVEAFGCGTITHDGNGGILPHIHTSLGLKPQSAVGHTSHLLSARVQFLTEMLVMEVVAPPITRVPDPNVYDVPLLRFGNQ